jgi:hypothetical protein
MIGTCRRAEIPVSHRTFASTEIRLPNCEQREAERRHALCGKRQNAAGNAVSVLQQQLYEAEISLARCRSMLAANKLASIEDHHDHHAKDIGLVNPVQARSTRDATSSSPHVYTRLQLSGAFLPHFVTMASSSATTCSIVKIVVLITTS